MPITATLSQSQTLHTSNFEIGVTLDMAIQALPKSIISLRTIAENGRDGVDFTVSGSDRTWNLNFTIPSEKEGTFEILIDGSVTPVGSSTPDSVMSNALVVVYDTTVNVSATIGPVTADSYKEDGVIAIPVTVVENVIISKNAFPITHVSGDNLSGVAYALYGENATYELVFKVPENKSGRFRISAEGDALKTNGVWDNVIATPVEVAYSTVEPELVDHRVVRTGGRIDVILQYGIDCTLNDPVTEFGDGAQFADFLDYAGTNLSPPNFYRKADNDYPDIPLPAELPEADWISDATLTTADATIYLLRWESVAESVEFNVTIKPGFVRGPVS